MGGGKRLLCDYDANLEQSFRLKIFISKLDYGLLTQNRIVLKRLCVSIFIDFDVDWNSDLFFFLNMIMERYFYIININRI